MALFTDGPISSIDDLAAQDSQLLEMAVNEGIDLNRKLALAQTEIGLEVQAMLSDLSFVERPLWLEPTPDLASIAVTPALKLWHTFRTLELVYSDAYNSQLNDRYSGKRDQFHERVKWARSEVAHAGIGVVWKPVAQAQTPSVTALPGTLPDGTYFVTAAWLNDAGEEGASAPPAVITTWGTTFQVEAGTPPRNAIGWNVYVGESAPSMYLQNTAPLAAGETRRQDLAVVKAGQVAGSGQAPAFLKPLPHILRRG